MAIRMQQRRGTSEQWELANPVLGEGEIGWESDTNKFKIGDGINNWDDLSYFLDEDALGGSIDDYVPLTQKGVANGVATLDANGKVPSTQLDIDELSQDAVNTALTAGTGISKTYNDEANTITVAVDSTIATKTYVDTAVGNVDLSGKQDKVTGVSDTEIGYLDGVTSAIQTQLNDKAPTANPTFTGVVSGAPAAAVAATAAGNLGYMGIPASGAGASGAYTLVAGDAGELVYTTTSRTVTIPANSSVPFQVGTSIVFISGAGATTTIAITSDTLILAKDGTTGSRTLAAHGMATAVKVAATTWYISGNGLT